MTRKELYNSIRGNLAKLRQFFAEMPKGGDLHNHLTGSAYAETYFEIACKKEMYADLSTGKLYKDVPSHPCTIVKLSWNMPDLHNIRMTLIDKWSLRNFQPYKCALGPDEYFFGEFGLFSAATEEDDLIRIAHELKVRAVEENVLYLEIMGTSPSVSPTLLDSDTYELCNNEIKNAYKAYYNGEKSEKEFVDTLDNVYAQLEGSTNVAVAIDQYVQQIERIDYESNASRVLPTDTCSLEGKSLTVRYQGYASRTKEPMDVFVQLYIVHKAMIQSDLIVGCNIVAAENSEKSMVYYKAHMLMFNELRAKLSDDKDKVHTSLHAGELTIGLIRPEHMTYHINDAVNIALADRIGHGVDIPFEHNSYSILREMRDRDIAVEINLTSNEFILGEKGDSHPFKIYKDAGVPMVICTDDPGILRTSLTEEYALAAYRYDLSYEDVKEMSRNAIVYSFLDSETKNELLKKYDNLVTAFELTDSDVPQEIVIVGEVMVDNASVKQSSSFQESGKDNSNKYSKFDCPPNCVITGRYHHGDENGKTYYDYGVPEIVFTDEENYTLALRYKLSPTVTLKASHEVPFSKESDHNCHCGIGECFTGRTHHGDENGSTEYRMASLDVSNTNGFSYEISLIDEYSVNKKESDNDAFYKLNEYDACLPMTGREHHGDENKDTNTLFSLYHITFRKVLK